MSDTHNIDNETISNSLLLKYDVSDDIYSDLVSTFSIEEAFLYEIGLLDNFQNEKNNDLFYTDELKTILKDEFCDIIASPLNSNLIKLIQRRKIPLFINEFVQDQINHLAITKKNFVIKSIERALPYIEEMKNIFKSNNIPEELAYLPLIESGFVNHARSNKGATGMWQFMPGTARWMGMKIDNFIDERRDPIIACKFAAKFLSLLYDKLGDWDLVLAAYNHGGRNILNELKRAKTNDFYDLVRQKMTPKETQNYVPRYTASIIILKDLEKYDIQTSDVSSDYIYYKLPFATPAFVVAKHADMSVNDFLKLNPALIEGYVPDPKYDYMVRLPKENYKNLIQNFDNLKEDVALSYIPYYIKQGDTLSEIAVRYGVSVAFIMKTNNIHSPNKLSLGQKIFLPLRGYQIAKKR